MRHFELHPLRTTILDRVKEGIEMKANRNVELVLTESNTANQDENTPKKSGMNLSMTEGLYFAETFLTCAKKDFKAFTPFALLRTNIPFNQVDQYSSLNPTDPNFTVADNLDFDVLFYPNNEEKFSSPNVFVKPSFRIKQLIAEELGTELLRENFSGATVSGQIPDWNNPTFFPYNYDNFGFITTKNPSETFYRVLVINRNLPGGTSPLSLRVNGSLVSASQIEMISVAGKTIFDKDPNINNVPSSGILSLQSVPSPQTPITANPYTFSFTPVNSGSIQIPNFSVSVLKVPVNNTSPVTRISIANPNIQVVEGKVAKITLDVFPAPSTAITVPFTLTGTPTNPATGADYTAPNLSVTIPAGSTSAFIYIPIVADNSYEYLTINPGMPNQYQLPEGFVLQLQTPSSGILTSPSNSTVYLLDTQVGSNQSPTISINDITVNENAGTATLQICASAMSSSPISVTYTASNGSATAGTDYTATPATVTIPANQTCVNVNFPIVDNTLQEPTESFGVTLSNPSGATIADGSGTVTILDNDNGADECANITILTSGSSISVSNLGSSPNYLVQVSNSSWNQVFSQFYTSNPGTVNVPNLPNGTYFVRVQLISASWSEVCKKDLYITVGGIPPVPTISISDITVNENAGTATLQICASAMSSSPISVTYTASNGSATAGTDYTATPATVTIPANQTCVNVNFPIVDNTVQEPTESFGVTLSNPSGATIADGSGTVTIFDNDNGADECANITILTSGSSISVSNLGSSPNYLVQVSNSSWNQVFSQFYTSNPGTVNVPNLPNGTYFVRVQLISASWSEVCKKDLYITVGGIPPVPTISISDITVNENAGTATLQICASAMSSSPISVTYTASNGSATAGTDYTATPATVTIPANQTCVNVNFPIVDNTVQEPTESFGVTLSNPSGATIADGSGTVTIFDNDSNPCTNVNVTTTTNSIAISNLSNPESNGITHVQVFGPGNPFDQTYNSGNPLPATVTVPSLSAGAYTVIVKFYNASWLPLCNQYYQTHSITSSRIVQSGQVSNPLSVGEVTSVPFYPNPANQFITCGLQGFGKAAVKVEIFNQYGTLVKFHEDTCDELITIDISDLLNGFYFVQFSPDGYRPKVEKLVVEHGN
jgi:hypothetical protein